MWGRKNGRYDPEGPLSRPLESPTCSPTQYIGMDIHHQRQTSRAVGQASSAVPQRSGHDHRWSVSVSSLWGGKPTKSIVGMECGAAPDHPSSLPPIFPAGKIAERALRDSSSQLPLWPHRPAPSRPDSSRQSPDDTFPYRLCGEWPTTGDRLGW